MEKSFLITMLLNAMEYIQGITNYDMVEIETEILGSDENLYNELLVELERGE